MQGAVEAETTQFPPPDPRRFHPPPLVECTGILRDESGAPPAARTECVKRMVTSEGRKTRGSECTVHTKKGDVAKRKRNAIRECAESSAGIEERQEWRVRNASEWEAEKEHSAIERIAALCRQQRSLISVAMGNSSVPAS
uniref:Uncharacterized protein n=1 Tax=Bursaphelenchus xylophilus TaxID=6326 RepID=A0A1I7S1L5_BURXY